MGCYLAHVISFSFKVKPDTVGLVHVKFTPRLLFTDRSTSHARTTQEVWWKTSVTHIGKSWR